MGITWGVFAATYPGRHRRLGRQRALTTTAATAIDILICSNDPADPAALTITRQIAAKVTGQ